MVGKIDPGPTATGCGCTACSLESPFTASQNKLNRSTMKAAEAAHSHREDGHSFETPVSKHCLDRFDKVLKWLDGELRLS